MNIPENFDRWMFDYMEGNLSVGEVEEFEQFLLQNPSFEPDADAWQNSIIPINSVVYPNQQNLERKRRFAGWYGWSAAAVLVLLIGTGGYLAMNNGSINDGQKTSQFAEASFAVQPQESLTSVEQSVESNLAENEAGLTSENTNQEIPSMQTQRQNGFTSTGTSANNHAQLISSNSNENQGVIGSNDFIEDRGSQYNGGDYYATVSAALQQEQDKYKSDRHAARYKHNPSEKNADLDLSKKSDIRLNSFASTTKRIYRKIEKMFGYPVGLVNLRDPDLALPENSIVSSNPGFAGGMLVPRFEMKYRNQWLGASMNSHKAQFSFDNYVHQVRGGFGVSVNSTTYNNGAFGDYSVDLTYSPKISLGRNIVFEPGIKVSLGVLTGNTSKFEGASSLELDRGLLLNNDLTYEFDRTDKLWYKDYGLGFVLNTKWFYAGFSADNLSGHYSNVYKLEGEIEPSRTPVLYKAVIGADYESANKNMALSPFIAGRKFGDSQELWAGMTYRLDHFTLAGAYSTSQDYTASIGIKFKKFKLAYQYDRTHTLLTNEQIGSHSIGIRFNGEMKNSRFK